MECSNFTRMLHKRTNKVTRVLVYVVLEWTLIFLLLLNSLFSYFIVKFAVYFGLKPPCLFCSRLDHHLSSQKSNKNDIFSCTKFICEQHASDISKAGYCSNHHKLFESRIVCDGCSSTRRDDVSLFKWMKEIGMVVDDDIVVHEDEDDVVVHEYDEDCVNEKCSCCDVVINPRKKVCSSSPYVDFMANMITDREFDGCFPNQENEDLVMVNERDLVSFDQFDSGYQVLDDGEDDEIDELEDNDVVLEADEKVPLLSTIDDTIIDDDNDNDNDNDNSMIVTSKNLCSDMLPQHLEFYINHGDYRLIPVEVSGGLVEVERFNEDTHKDDDKSNLIEGENDKTLNDVDLIFEGNILRACFEVKDTNLPSIQEEEEEEEEDDDDDEKIQVYELPQELDEEEKKEMEDLCALQEQERSNVSESTPILQEMVEEFLDSAPAVYKEEMESHLGKDEIGIEENENLTQEVLNEVVEDLTPCNDLSSTFTDHGFCEVSTSSMQVPSTDENDAVSVTEARAENDIGTCSEINGGVDVEMGSPDYDIEEEKSLDSRFCEGSTSSIHLPSTDEKDVEVEAQAQKYADESVEVNERSLNVTMGYANHVIEEEKNPETPTSTESLNMHKKLPLLGRRGSITEESLDGSIISENEVGDGATLIEKLKSELQSEKKTLRALYAELEEERNASAIAANQTLAMINRLQEEKATMQMEALQYQRMMEEQSEYDQEALQMMNELMVKREKEKQELEKEVEVYRKRLVEFEEREKVRILSRRMEGSLRSRNSSASCSYGEESDGLSIDLNHEVKDQDEGLETTVISPHCQEENGHQGTPSDSVINLQDSLVGFEDERQSILEQLKVLEEKLFTLAEEEEEDEYSEEFFEENGNDEVNANENGVNYANGKHHEKWLLNGSMQKRLLPLFDEVELLESSNNGDDFDMVLNKSPIAKFELEKKRLAIEEEVDHVYERLHALEADREFLKHCIGSLKKGDKGLDLLQEILQHLRDLKNVELQVMKNMDPNASVNSSMTL